MSDQKRLFYAGGPRGENLEHQQNGLIWALANRSQWHVTASRNPSMVQQAVDGDMNTRYHTGSYQAPGMWSQFELP